MVWMITGLLINAASLKAQEQTVNRFSVQQAVEYASKNNLQVKNQLEAIKAQEQVNREVTSMAYPQISSSIGFSYFPSIPVQSFPNFISMATYGVLEKEGVKDGNGNAIISPNDFGFIQAQFGTRMTASASVDMSWILFDGQVFVGLQARDAVMLFVKKSKEVTEEQIKTNIHKIYYQLLIGKKQIDAIDANIFRFEKLSRDVKIIYQNGFAEKLDVDRVTVALTNLKTEKIKIENMIESGFSGMKFLMGMPQKDQLILTDSITDQNIADDLADAMYNYNDRKEFQQIEIAEKLAGYNVKRYKLSYYPTLAAFGSYSRNAQRNKFNFFDFSESWFPTGVVGVKLSMPIFSGFAKDSRVKKAQIELNQTKNQKEMLKQSIDMEVVQSRIKINSALLTITAQKDNMKLAEEVFNVATKKFEQGVGPNQDIINAQTELKTAQTNYYAALYDAIIAKTDYLKATGKL
jgi:outer membrane protein